jgi:hypothetical protein
MGMVQSSRKLHCKEENSTEFHIRGGEDYPFMLEQYGMYKMFGWEDLGHVLGAGKEEEAKTLGASIR